METRDRAARGGAGAAADRSLSVVGAARGGPAEERSKRSLQVVRAIHAVDLATLRAAEGLRRSAARPQERIAPLPAASAEPCPLLLELADVDGDRRRAFGRRRPRE